MHSDDSFKKLQGADPVRAQLKRGEFKTDLPALEALVRARTTTVSDLGERRRHQRFWVPAAAAIAGFALAGGGYLAGSGAFSGHSSPQSGADQAVPASAERTNINDIETASEMDGAAEEHAEMEPAGIGPAELDPAELSSAGVDSAMAGPEPLAYEQLATYSWSELSTEIGQMNAYAFDSAMNFTPEVARTFAQSVGLADASSAQVEEQIDGALVVGAHSDAVVELFPDAVTSVHVSAPDHLTQGTAAVSSEDAQAAVQQLFEQIGIETGNWQWEITEDSGASQQVVAYEVFPYGEQTQTGTQVQPQQQGLRVRSVYATVSAAGIVSLEGSVAPLVDLGKYPIVSEQQAAQRLGDSRFQLPAEAQVQPPAANESGGSAAQPLQPGASIEWPVTEHHISYAQLGYQIFELTPGSWAVLPAYEFQSDTGVTFWVLAVAESALEY